jgi:hypothetical protein
MAVSGPLVTSRVGRPEDLGSHRRFAAALVPSVWVARQVALNLHLKESRPELSKTVACQPNRTSAAGAPAMTGAVARSLRPHHAVELGRQPASCRSVSSATASRVCAQDFHVDRPHRSTNVACSSGLEASATSNTVTSPTLAGGS